MTSLHDAMSRIAKLLGRKVEPDRTVRAVGGVIVYDGSSGYVDQILLFAAYVKPAMHSAGWWYDTTYSGSALNATDFAVHMRNPRLRIRTAYYRFSPACAMSIAEARIYAAADASMLEEG